MVDHTGGKIRHDSHLSRRAGDPLDHQVLPGLLSTPMVWPMLVPDETREHQARQVPSKPNGTIRREFPTGTTEDQKLTQVNGRRQRRLRFRERAAQRVGETPNQLRNKPRGWHGCSATPET